MKKIKLFLLISLIFLCGQINCFSQNNTTLGLNANPSDLGSHNTALGFKSMQLISGGSYNVSVGMECLLNNTTGNYNVGVGYRSLKTNTSGQLNTAVGHTSLILNTTGVQNVAIGMRSLEKSGTGSYNVGVGPVALGNITNSNDNTAIGTTSMNQLTSGSGNTAIGRNSGNSLIEGNYNTFVGFDSGKSILNGSNNIIIGSANCLPDLNNTIILGTRTSQRLYIHSNGNVGIGLGNNIIPQNKLEVRASTNNNSGLRFTSLTSSFNPTTNASKFLTVNATGDVVLQNVPLGSGGVDVNIYNDNGSLSSDRTMDMNDFNLHFNTSNSPSNGKIYIGDTPDYPTATGEYKLYVEGGILTEKVKVALRSTANWADYVFADDYKLKPLKEVEEFIKANNHLPGIESARELVEKGLDLGEMQAKQMGKIEELTLYIIEQDKKLEQQSKDIEELKALVKVLAEKQ